MLTLKELTSHCFTLRICDSRDETLGCGYLTLVLGSQFATSDVSHRLELCKDNGDSVQKLFLAANAYETPAARDALMTRIITLAQDWLAYVRELEGTSPSFDALPPDFMRGAAWSTFFHSRYGQDYTPAHYGIVSGGSPHHSHTGVTRAGGPVSLVFASGVLPQCGPPSGVRRPVARRVRNRDDEVTDLLMAADEVGPRSTRRRRTGSSPSP